MTDNNGEDQTHRQQQQQLLYQNDIVLRSPLDPYWSLRTVVVRQNHAFRKNAAADTEAGLRRLLRPRISALWVGAHFLQLQKLETIFTAGVLLHRYYCASILGGREDPDRNNTITTKDEDPEDWKYVVASCLFLACKREEEPRRLRDVVNLAHALSFLEPRQQQQPRDDENNNSSILQPDVLTWNPTPLALDASYWAAKQRLVETELRVLRWLALDIAVPYPHRAVVQLLQLYLYQGGGGGGNPNYNTTASDDHDNNNNNQSDRDDNTSTNDNTTDTTAAALHALQPRLVRVAFRRLHDALYSSVALQQPVLALAVAAVEWALRERNGQHNDDDSNTASLSWWNEPLYGLDETTLQAIPTALQCLQDVFQSLILESNNGGCGASVSKKVGPT